MTLHTLCTQVQIKPWRIADSCHTSGSGQSIDCRKAVFVGGVPRPLRACELAEVMRDRIELSAAARAHALFPIMDFIAAKTASQSQKFNVLEANQAKLVYTLIKIVAEDRLKILYESTWDHFVQHQQKEEISLANCFQ